MEQLWARHMRALVKVGTRGRTDSSGSVAVIFGLSVFVLCGAIGLGLDYGRAMAVRSCLQAAVDVAALGAAPTGASNDPMMASRVQDAFDYNMQNNKQTAVAITVSAEAIPRGVRVTATAKLPTTFGRVIGINSVPIGVVAEAISAKTAFEIALVLDNTGSMAGSKIADLQTAAKNLVDEVVSLSDPGAVKFALVPFSNYVNVGMGYRGAQWLSVPTDYTEYVTQCSGTCPVARVRVTGTCTNDGVSSSCSGDQCPVRETQTCTSNNPVTHTWNGCVGSRKPEADVTVTASFSSPIPGLIDAGCPAPLARLTTDSGSIRTQIDAMWANGETYIAAGLMWGWRVLTPLPPFADGAVANSSPPTRKVMILMTDGENTKSQLDITHEGGDTVASDATMGTLCTSIKSADIEIYAVAFTVTNSQTKTKLQTCASDAGHFFDASDGAALQQAFAQIGGSLKKLTLSH